MYKYFITILTATLLSNSAQSKSPYIKQNAQSSNVVKESAAPYASFKNRLSDECYRALNHDAADLCAQWRAVDAAENSLKLVRQGNFISLLPLYYHSQVLFWYLRPLGRLKTLMKLVESHLFSKTEPGSFLVSAIAHSGFRTALTTPT